MSIPALQSSLSKLQTAERARDASVASWATSQQRSYVMIHRTLEPALVLGPISVLALSTATPSMAQTQRQRPPVQEEGFAPASPPAGETVGQAPPRAQSRNTSPAQHTGAIRTRTHEDFGVGRWVPFSRQK